jgi:hypothetical protein
MNIDSDPTLQLRKPGEIIDSNTTIDLTYPSNTADTIETTVGTLTGWDLYLINTYGSHKDRERVVRDLALSAYPDNLQTTVETPVLVPLDQLPTHQRPNTRRKLALNSAYGKRPAHRLPKRLRGTLSRLFKRLKDTLPTDEMWCLPVILLIGTIAALLQIAVFI